MGSNSGSFIGSYIGSAAAGGELVVWEGWVVRIRHSGTNEGTERKSNDSFFFGSVTFI